MKLKHTPGPWIFRPDFSVTNDRPDEEWQYVKDICIVCIGDIDDEQEKSQAKKDGLLIAASPDMIKLLIECYSVLEGYSNGGLLFKPLRIGLKDTIERATSMTIDEILQEVGE